VGIINYLSVPITHVVPDTNTKQNFKALSSLLFHLIQENDVNKWIILSKFFKSINTTISQLSQAKATSEQAEKQLVDYKVKLATHDKY